MNISDWPRQIRDRYVHAPDGIPTDDVSKVAEEIAWFIEQAIAQHGGKMDQNIDITQNVEKLRALVLERGGRIERLERALRRLSFAAQTTGGTTGRDDELVAAIAQADEALADDAAGAGDEKPPHLRPRLEPKYSGVIDTPPQHRDALEAFNRIMDRIPDSHFKGDAIMQMANDEQAVRHALAQQNSAENKHSYAVPEAVRRLPDEWRSRALHCREVGQNDHIDGHKLQAQLMDDRAAAFDGRADELDRALAQHSEPGRRQVPVEPTEAMIRALRGKVISDADSARRVYAGLLAAAPAPDADERE